jgi:hypothetical protein
VKSLDQFKNIVARDTSEDTELVLEANNVETTAIYQFGCAGILAGLILIDRCPDDWWKGILASLITHRENGCASDIRQVGNRLLEVSRKSCNAAAARQRVADECDAEGKPGQVASELAFQQFAKAHRRIVAFLEHGPSVSLIAIRILAEQLDQWVVETGPVGFNLAFFS